MPATFYIERKGSPKNTIVIAHGLDAGDAERASGIAKKEIVRVMPPKAFREALSKKRKSFEFQPMTADNGKDTVLSPRDAIEKLAVAATSPTPHAHAIVEAWKAKALEGLK